MMMLASALLLAAAQTSAAPFVLAIGVNDPGRAGLAALQFADDDAAEAVQLFAGRGEGEYLHTRFDTASRERFPLLAAQAKAPTRAAIAQSVAAMRLQIAQALRRGESPHVVVWLAGHGAYDEDGHMYFPLSGGERLTRESLTTDIVEPLTSAHRVHLVVDTCYAAGLVGARAQVEPVSAREVERGFIVGGPGRFANVGILTGASASAASYEWTEISSGVFSAVIRAGLRGAADVDGDGAIRYSELVAFSTAVAEGVRVQKARPEIHGEGPRLDRDAPLAYRSWLGPTTTLTGDLSAMGTVHIMDDTGRWLLASRFEKGYAPTLWLPADTPLYLRARGRDHPLVRDAQGALVVGEAVRNTSAARSLMDNALRSGLFASTWGPAYWRGYRAATRGVAEVSPAAEPATTGAVPYAAVATGVGALLAAAVAAGGIGIGAFSYVRFTEETRQVPALQLYTVASIAFGVGAGAAIAAVFHGALFVATLVLDE